MESLPQLLSCFFCFVQLFNFILIFEKLRCDATIPEVQLFYLNKGLSFYLNKVDKDVKLGLYIC